MNAQNVVPRLRRGAGESDGSTGLCGMQVISWESGDTTITDMPACADQALALIVQRVNDSMCTRRDGGLLCPECSIKVLDLAHRTVGTGTLPLSELERRVVWVRVAADQARSVLHLASDRAVAIRAIEAAEAWANEPSAANASAAASFAAAVCFSYAVNGANASASNGAAAAYASNAAFRAANAVAYAGYAADALLRCAHRAIDVFERCTGHVAAPADPAVTARGRLHDGLTSHISKRGPNHPQVTTGPRSTERNPT